MRQLFRTTLSRLKRRQHPKPLVSRAHDITLLKRAFGRRRPRLRQILHIERILAPWERRVIRLCFAFLLVGCVWVGAQFIRQYRVPVAAVGGRYVEAEVGSPALINPLFASLSDVDMDITRLVYSGLMRYDGQERLVPDLAASSTVSADKKVYTFDLRQDVVWHDGEPFTARDVVFTFEMLQDPDVGSPLLVTFQGVQVEAEGDYRVRFTLKESFTPFLSTLTVGIIPEHIWSGISGDRVRLHKKNIQPVGTGPFQFNKFIKDDAGVIYQYALKRFPRYYRQGAYLEEFVFQFFPSYDGEGGAIQAVREQRVDGLSFIPHDLKDKVERKHLAIHTLQLPQYTALFFNKEHQPLLREVDVRIALEQAVDKERILRETLRGEGEVISSPILPGYPGYDPGASRLAYALETANTSLDKYFSRVSADEYRTVRRQELLTAMGLSAATTTVSSSAPLVLASTTTQTSTEVGGSEIEAILDAELPPAQTFYRKSKDGTPLILTLVTADTPEYRRVAELVAGFWQEVGVKTNLRFVPPRDMSRVVLKTRDYDVLLYGAIIGSDPDQYPLWHSSQIDFPGLNLARYVNRTADGFLEKARETTSDEERVEAYKKFQETLLAEHPAIFLYTPTYAYVTNDRLQGVEAIRVFHPSDRLNTVTNWYVKTKGQWRW